MRCLLAFPISPLRGPFGPSALACLIRPLLTSAASQNRSLDPQSCIQNKRQISRGKFDRLPHATAGSTTGAFDGYGLRCYEPTRPAPYASHPILVHRPVRLLHASFRPRLATTPLRFAITSPPSGCEKDFHLRAVEHARHTRDRGEPRGSSPPTPPYMRVRIRRFGGLSSYRTVSRGIPSELK